VGPLSMVWNRPPGQPAANEASLLIRRRPRRGWLIAARCDGRDIAWGLVGSA
jgi:hypothetical protein